jgi:hypothetical protein
MCAILVAGLLSGCAEMSATEKGAAIGAGTGALAGAIIGNQVRGNRPQHAAMGAIIGGLAGAAGGALIGREVERRQQAAAPAPPAPVVGTPSAAPPPQTAVVTVPGQYGGDPTRGDFVNQTRWRVNVYVDADPTRTAGPPTFALGPGERRAVDLDVGPHRVVAQAFVDTQFGPRLVGRLDRQIEVDPRRPGWSLAFGDADFR